MQEEIGKERTREDSMVTTLDILKNFCINIIEDSADDGRWSAEHMKKVKQKCLQLCDELEQELIMLKKENVILKNAIDDLIEIDNNVSFYDIDNSNDDQFQLKKAIHNLKVIRYETKNATSN